MSSGSKDPYLNSEEWLGGPPHLSHRCLALPPWRPLLGVIFLRHPFPVSPDLPLPPVNLYSVGIVLATQGVNLGHCQHTLLGSWEKSHVNSGALVHGNDLFLSGVLP